jgi:hypothetical protein
MSSLIAVTLVAASCGGGSGGGGGGAAKLSSTRAGHAQPPAVNAPPANPRSGAPPPGSVRVIKAWADALRRGDVRTAASYFRLPSELINVVSVNGLQQLIRIHTLAQAERANETLPCGAKFISASKRGPFVNALFRLTGRSGPGGSACGPGVGQTARTDFVIQDGKIVEWLRAPDEPGDNGNGGSPPSNGPPPVV